MTDAAIAASTSLEKVMKMPESAKGIVYMFNSAVDRKEVNGNKILN